MEMTSSEREGAVALAVAEARRSPHERTVLASKDKNTRHHRRGIMAAYHRPTLGGWTHILPTGVRLPAMGHTMKAHAIPLFLLTVVACAPSHPGDGDPHVVPARLDGTPQATSPGLCPPIPSAACK